MFGKVGKLLSGATLLASVTCGYSMEELSLVVPEDNPYIAQVLKNIDFENVISSTVTIDECERGTPLYSVDADNAYGGSDLPINWDEVYRFALKGNPAAQFIHGNRCIRLATRLYNGECIKKKFEAYMFLLISAIKGKFKDSEDCFAYMGDISGLKTKFELSDLIKTATDFSMRF